MSFFPVGLPAAANFATVDAKTYTFDVTAAADGDVTVGIAANVAEDALGNGNRTLVAVSDDNFNPLQITQFLAFEYLETVR